MQSRFPVKNFGTVGAVLFAVFVGSVFVGSTLSGQETPAPAASAEARTDESSVLAARVAATDYQAHKQVGAFNLAAEFTGHSIPTPQAIYTTEEYVAVEVAFFGAPDARLKLSADDFSIRINGKKTPSPAQPYALVFSSLKDPSWEPPDGDKGKTKTGGLSTGGGGNSNDPPPTPAKMPLELKRVMQQRVQKSVLREGDRTLPEAGFLYFQYGGKAKGIRTIELIYNGPAGMATLALQP